MKTRLIAFFRHFIDMDFSDAINEGFEEFAKPYKKKVDKDSGLYKLNTNSSWNENSNETILKQNQELS